MQSPYRPKATESVALARTLAGPNRRGTLGRLAVVAVILDALAWALVAGVHPGVIGLLGGLAVAAAFVAVRSLHEWSLPHRVVADSRGVELAWAQKVPWRPWMRRNRLAIAWDDLLEVRTSTVSNDGTGKTTLLFERMTGPRVEIPDGVFSDAMGVVQQAIQGELEERAEVSRRELVDGAGLCRARFQTAQRVRCRANLDTWALGVIAIGGVAAVAVVVASRLGGIAHLLLTAPMLLAAGLALRALWTVTGARVLHLRAEGLVYDAFLSRPRVIPWSEIRFAHPTVIDGEVVAVRVATKSGDDLELRGDWAVPLPELARLISPRS